MNRIDPKQISRLLKEIKNLSEEAKYRIALKGVEGHPNLKEEVRKINKRFNRK